MELLNLSAEPTQKLYLWLPPGESKEIAAEFDFDALRRRVLMPAGLEGASLRTEGPYAYRDLDACLALIDGFVPPVAPFGVIGYMGHL